MSSLLGCSVKEGDSPSQRTLRGTGGGHVSNWQSEAGPASPLSGKAKRTTERREGEEAAFVTNLNSFYCRFDTQDFSATTEGLRNELQHEIKERRGQPIALTEREVRQGLRRLNPSKATGPDLIKGG